MGFNVHGHHNTVNLPVKFNIFEIMTCEDSVVDHINYVEENVEKHPYNLKKKTSLHVLSKLPSDLFHQYTR